MFPLFIYGKILRNSTEITSKAFALLIMEIHQSVLVIYALVYLAFMSVCSLFINVHMQSPQGPTTPYPVPPS